MHFLRTARINIKKNFALKWWNFWEKYDIKFLFLNYAIIYIQYLSPLYPFKYDLIFTQNAKVDIYRNWGHCCFCCQPFSKNLKYQHLHFWVNFSRIFPRQKKISYLFLFHLKLNGTWTFYWQFLRDSPMISGKLWHLCSQYTLNLAQGVFLTFQ